MKIFLLILTLLPLWTIAQSEKYSRVVKLMGSRYEITVVAANQAEADRFIDLAIGEIDRIEKLISEWKSDTEVAEINRQAGIHPVRVSDELYNLIVRSNLISDITAGAFDISYASMDRVWKYDGSMTRMPTEEEIKQSVARIGFRHILLDKEKQTVFLDKQGMKIGFGAIGKGYSADKASDLLEARGVKGGIINASGDLTTWGTQPDGSPWMVGISNPLDHNKVFSWFPLSNRAVVTSGNYEKFVEFEGKRYSHIIDPRTGYPASGLASVTVFAPKAELADALATAIFVMGKEVGLDFVNQLKEIECVMVDDQGRIFTSNDIQLNSIKP